MLIQNVIVILSKNKNIYTRLLINGLKQINEGKIKNADIDLKKTTIKQAIRLVKQAITLPAKD